MSDKSEPPVPVNAALYAAVRDAKISAVQGFTAEGVDWNSEAFLSRFPFIFVEEIEGGPIVSLIGRELVAAAFSDEFRYRTEEAIDIFYANYAGGTKEHLCLDLIDDFLNYALPRTVGLPDEDAIFDDLYRRLEADLFTDSYALRVIALLHNTSDHGGRFHPTCGLSFAWAEFRLG